MTRPAGSIDILSEIARVLEIEANALVAIRGNLTAAFRDAVDWIHACPGQVCVTGLGKSGIVARKIAATLRSTGTPAVFLHSADALHGDLGMVRPEDIVLAVGKSGETPELNALLRILKKNGNRIISLTSNPDSAMAALSDLVLDLRIEREACPLNLAPTASTTGAIAVGDAIAVTLMKLREITEEDFARRHPGGQLGARLTLSVADVMRKGEHNPVISVHESIKEMLIQITAFRVGAISVIDDAGRLLGLVTDFDVRRVLQTEEALFSLGIADIMNCSPETVAEDAKAADVFEFMRLRPKPIAVIPVVNASQEVVGMVHLHDLLAAGL